MNFTETISAQMKAAMLSGDKLRLETLRSLRAGILEFEKSGTGKELTEEDALKIVSAGVKKRKDAIEQFELAGRTEAANKEKEELAILMEFMPSQLSEEEVVSIITSIISSTGAASASDFGKVMGAAMKELKGKADGALIQSTVKSLLG